MPVSSWPFDALSRSPYSKLHASVTEEDAEPSIVGTAEEPEAEVQALLSVGGPAGTSMPVLMGDSWPLNGSPDASEAADMGSEAEAEHMEMASSHGGDCGSMLEWLSSESMLWLSDHGKSPSSDTTGIEVSIARQ